jgi:hypothetical protein
MFEPLARKEKLIVEQMADEVLIYDLERHKAHCLNLTAAAVWQHCNGKNNVAQIARLVSRNLQATVSEEVVLLALNQLEKFHLLDDKHDSFFALPKVSRRDVMKRVGVASIIALPVIFSVISPTAFACTSCTPGQPCMTPSDCACPTCTGTCTGSPGTCI